jgi:hypothetical protein
MFFDFNLYFELLEYLLRQNSAIICRQIVETYVFFFLQILVFIFFTSLSQVSTSCRNSTFTN